MIDPRAEYTQRIAAIDARLQRAERRHQSIANARLSVAFVTLLVVWAIFGRGWSPWALAAPAVVFAVLAAVHDRVLSESGRQRRARKLYERGQSRLDGTWQGAGADGAAFAVGSLIARDLDLFGRASAFQLINTARTEAGELALARWLTALPTIDDVAARQQSVDELRPMIDFRERLSLAASSVPLSRTGVIAAWASTTTPMFGARMRLIFTILTAISVVLVSAELLGWFPAPMLVLWLVVQGGIAMIWGRRLVAALGGVDAATEDLTLLKQLLQTLEAQAFASTRLAALRDALTHEGRLASARIAELERLVSALDACRNQLVAPIAILFQVQAHLIMAIDRWRVREASRIALWLDIVGEFEALASLATYAFEHPDDPFPELVDGPPRFEGDALGHPLLDARTAVRNTVHIGGGRAPHLLMISGSNMSGKSTLMRTVGLNVVLALAGAPVRAARVVLSPTRIGSSMRVEDSLQDGQSRFYAEITRLKAILELTESPDRVLFLLDELLSGTNSFDRRVGAEAVIRALVEAGAIGLVTTHDLALTELVSTLDVPADNVHFDDRVEGDRMIFDYTMRPGVVERSNALELMRAIGIKVGRQ